MVQERLIDLIEIDHAKGLYVEDFERIMGVIAGSKILPLIGELPGVEQTSLHKEAGGSSENPTARGEIWVFKERKVEGAVTHIKAVVIRIFPGGAMEVLGDQGYPLTSEECRNQERLREVLAKSWENPLETWGSRSPQ